MLKERSKSFPKPKDPVLDFATLESRGTQLVTSLGLGKYNKKLPHYSGLKPHDFRRSAARNLDKAGVPRRVAMLITGHKTEHMHERYNIKNTDDVKEALIKVGHFKRASVTPIADLATSR